MPNKWLTERPMVPIKPETRDLILKAYRDMRSMDRVYNTLKGKLRQEKIGMQRMKGVIRVQYPVGRGAANRRPASIYDKPRGSIPELRFRVEDGWVRVAF